MRRWHPTSRTFKSVIKRVKVGDAISNPVCSTGRSASKAARDAAYRLADQIDAALSARGLKIDHPHTCIGFVEKK